jgi:FkbH-like protein
MATAKPEFDAILRVRSRDALQGALWRWPLPLTLPQAEQVRAHAMSLDPPPQPLRLGVVHTYTSDLLQPWLAFEAACEGFDLQAYHAPYGLAMNEAAPDSRLVAFQPDICLLMLRREDLHPDLSAPIVHLGAERLAALREESLARLREIVSAFRAQPVGQIVVSLLPSPLPASLGHYDLQAAASEAQWWLGLKTALTRWLRDHCPASTFVDLDDVATRVGTQSFFDHRYWYSARYPFSAPAAAEFARRVVVVGVLLKQPRAKVLVLDADNTLWGGIVGEDGFDGIAIGPDYPGNAYLDFQRRILDFQQRGLVLAMCSKNNPADVEQVLRDHTHQLLRDGHFAARRVNWTPKAENLRSLAEELNLGLDSFIFVDDSDHECAAVRHALPQVQVVQVPARAVDVPGCLDRVARLEVLSLTSEDLAKTHMYAQERKRREILEGAAQPGGGDYLARLQMKMRVGVDPLPHLARLSQLTKKTNQFNLTTRRYDEQQVRAFIDGADTLVLDFSLADTFGDSGIVGLAIWRLRGAQAELDTFLMSCRVIGRLAETAFLEAGLRLLAARGVTELVADYLPTAKNDLVREFLPQHRFAASADGRFHRSLLSEPPAPAERFPIEVAVEAAARAESGVLTP